MTTNSICTFLCLHFSGVKSLYIALLLLSFMVEACLLIYFNLYNLLVRLVIFCTCIINKTLFISLALSPFLFHGQTSLLSLLHKHFYLIFKVVLYWCGFDFNVCQRGFIINYFLDFFLLGSG